MKNLNMLFISALSPKCYKKTIKLMTKCMIGSFLKMKDLLSLIINFNYLKEKKN